MLRHVFIIACIFPALSIASREVAGQEAGAESIVDRMGGNKHGTTFSAESFRIDGRPAFILWPPEGKRQQPQPWVMYAPTLPVYPNQDELWMFNRLAEAGIAIAGIDVGESYGSSEAEALFTAFYDELTGKLQFAAKPCLLARSRGGLPACNWAINNPDRVAGIAGIYPVFDLRTCPGLEKAARAYGLTKDEFESVLEDHNPISRIHVLAESGVRMLIVHGDADDVVPLKQNGAAVAEAYRHVSQGDAITLIVAKDQGHSAWEGYFQHRGLVKFTINRARAGCVTKN